MNGIARPTPSRSLTRGPRNPDSSKRDANSGSWIAASAKWIETRYQPTLSLVYLPHLDYNLQRHGPYCAASATSGSGALSSGRAEPGSRPADDNRRPINPAVTRDLELAYLPFLRGKGIAQYTGDPVFQRLLDEEGRLFGLRFDGQGFALLNGAPTFITLAESGVGLVHLRARGAELDEIYALADRIVTLYEGRITGEYPPDAEPEEIGVGMLVLTDLTGAATRLARDLFGRLERLRVYERERRLWLPHVTVLRFRERPRLKPPLPELGEFSPSDAAVYHSVLRSAGAQYVVVESFALGG